MTLAVQPIEQPRLKAPANDGAIELTILMPCLNEAETIEVCVRKAMGYLAKSGVSGEFRYFGSPLSRTRPPKAMTRPRASRMGTRMRSRKRS